MGWMWGGTVSMSAMAMHLWIRMGLFIACGLSSLPVLAQPDKQKDPLSWDRNIRGLVDRYCTKCHRADKVSGDVNLAQDIDLRLILEHRDTWQTALAQIQNADMPPADAKQPTSEERELMIQFLKVTLEELDCSVPDPGKPVLRRLNRIEYDLSILDVTGLDLRLAEGFAPDGTAHGFDTIADALSLSPSQVEQYYDAAKKLVATVSEHRGDRPEVYLRVLGMKEMDGDAERIRMHVESFASRAFRRPAPSDYVDNLMRLYARLRSKGTDHETALGQIIQAILISPKFLMRVEQDRPNTDEPYPVDDYELASRLSYFLWSRPPDDRLIQLARDGKLMDAAVRKEEVARMIADPKSLALVDQFFGQWLSFRDIAMHSVDGKQFPEFDEALRNSMVEEVRLVLHEMLQKNRSLAELIDADYTYIDRRLSEHYGLPYSAQQGFQRIALTDHRRGGLLTSAALLTLQSDPGRTNVPRRGNFIAGRILGAPPPPPPPNVPPLEESASDGKKRTLREILEIHRSKPECASCHDKMDPLGLAFENYDAIGRWRTEEHGIPIDASGKLVQGQAFQGPEDFKKILIDQKDQVARTLIKNLLIYALGRGLQRPDECTVRSTLEKARAEDYRLGSIVESIIESYPFLHRRNAP